MRDPEATTEASVGIVPELRRSWRAMVAIVLGMGVGVLPVYSIGAFISPIAAEMNWSETQVVGWALAHAAGAVISAPFIGVLSDRFGPRQVAMGGLSLLALVLFATSFLPPILPLLYLSGFSIGVASVGTSAITYGRIIAGLFNRGMATAFGLMSCGIGLSAGFGPRLMQAVMDDQGWRTAFLLAGIAPLLVLPAAWFWLKVRASGGVSGRVLDQVGHTLKTAVRLPVFWVLAAGTVLYGLCAGGMAVNLIPYLTSEGISRTEAATALGLLGVSTMAGRFLTGVAIDHFQLNAGLFMVGAVIIQTGAFALLGLTSTQYMLIAIPIFGLTMGAEADCVAYITAKLFGRRAFSSIFGIVGHAMLYLGTGAGPVLFSIARDITGGYSSALYIWAGIAFSAVPLFLIVSRAIATGRTFAAAPQHPDLRPATAG
ncbi:MAG: MFS transporter [Candidatus Brevundimonas colombiensis]|uniref:MFS transporter n=1 Tax=Candidatus Brevundimonas colombiensis TaxID=3121376 RepID=A0AAJ5X2Q7_9CAUL|nr:MFS transporter [Brevundimonas sp.]WEK39988.1 MAG: MFS transporter [Brevundimonas sp.]